MNYEKTKVVLNQAIADLSELSALIHQIHWYMRGSGFLYLHEKMDELRSHVEEELDEVAERLIALGGTPFSTLTEFENNSRITMEHTTYDLSLTERLRNLVTAFRYMAKLHQDSIHIAANEEDDVTMDLLTTSLAWYQKQIWMLQAELGESPLN